MPDPKFPLLRRIDYLQTSTRFVSLCALQTPYGPDVRLYKWRRNNTWEEWRVSLANLSVQKIDLGRIADDAKTLAAEFGVQLDWDAENLGDDTELDELEAVIKELNAKMLKSKRPACASCNGGGSVVPLTYGVPNQLIEDESGFAFGGYSFNAESPLWYCKDCGAKWGDLKSLQRSGVPA